MATERPGTRMDAERERGLVVRARTDPAAYGELFDFHLPRVYGFIARRVGDRASAERICSATFQRGREAVEAGTLREASLGGWLVRVAATAIADQAGRADQGPADGMRSGDRAAPDAERSAALVGDDAATAVFAAALDRDDLRRGLARITEPQRRILVLKFLDGLTPAELCTALGISATTLDVRLNRALRALHTASAGRATHAA
jgi:RNA polymerase sigma-70 factor (ECF subfamily)